MLQVPYSQKNKTLKFCTGSSYTGKTNSEGKMTGFGIYRFPDGTEYRGHFKNGIFHGRGMIIEKSKFKMCGYFVNGKCENYDMFFDDGLMFNEQNWKYCSESDRRFWIEINQGIPPVGETFLTKDKPSRIIPSGHYDTEEGFFDPKNNSIVDVLTGNRIRYVSSDEKKRIMENCRMNQNDFEITGKVRDVDMSTDSWVSIDE